MAPVSGCALAVLVGIMFMGLNDAPVSFLVLNLSALAIAAFVANISRSMDRVPPLLVSGAAIAALGFTLLIGPNLEDIRRWMALGPVYIHVGMLVLPALCVAAARGSPKQYFMVLAVTSAILALQPDRGAAIGLFAATAMLAFLKKHIWSWLTVVASGAALAVTIHRPDPFEGVPFAEYVIQGAVNAHILLGAMVALSLAVAIFVPVFKAVGGDGGNRTQAFGFSAFFGGLVLASLLGDYPTPLVGYGASPIIGYGLGIALLTNSAEEKHDG